MFGFLKCYKFTGLGLIYVFVEVEYSRVVEKDDIKDQCKKEMYPRVSLLDEIQKDDIKVKTICEGNEDWSITIEWNIDATGTRFEKKRTRQYFGSKVKPNSKVLTSSGMKTVIMSDIRIKKIRIIILNE